MDFNEYQQKTSETAIYRTEIIKYVEQLEIPDAKKADELIDLMCLMYVVLGLSGEAGELAGKTKKILRDGGGRIGAYREDMLKENGDNVYYSARVSFELSENFEKTAVNNINKLLQRKENGTIQGSGDNR